MIRENRYPQKIFKRGIRENQYLQNAIFLENIVLENIYLLV